jgi:hypothetical protein
MARFAFTERAAAVRLARTLGVTLPAMRHMRYALIAAVVFSSVVAAALLPHGELIQTLAAIPIFGALAAVVVEILRDQAKRQHDSEISESQHRFALAAGSHMAATAFDKQVAFCEEYVAEVLSALRTLFREGPTQEALAHSDRLNGIKQKYVLWIARDLESRLDPFEKALRRVGVANFVSQQFPGSEGHQQRTKDMFRHFVEVLGTEHMGKEWEGEPITDAAAVSKIILHLRDALGIEELTRLRAAIIQQSLGDSQ